MQTSYSLRYNLEKLLSQDSFYPVLFLDYYLQTFNKDNVELVTQSIQRVTSQGIQTEDGREHQLDTIIYATGFDLEASLKAYTQTGTGELDNLEEFKKSPYAYKGITHPHHPNFFFLLGRVADWMILMTI